MSNTNKKENKSNKKFYILSIITLIIIFAVSYILLDQKYTNPKNIKEAKSIKISSNQKEYTQEETFKNVKTTIADKDFTQNMRIEELQESLAKLELKLDAININNELPKVVLAFLELRNAIDMEKNYETKLQAFMTLSFKDMNLRQKSNDLFLILQKKNFDKVDIKSEFNDSIKKIYFIKLEQNSNKDFSSKIKNLFAKLIIVRRVDGRIVNQEDEIDLAILKIEQDINNEFYQDALSRIEDLDEIYQKQLQPLKKKLKIQSNLEEKSQDILLYLKAITNNV